MHNVHSSRHALHVTGVWRACLTQPYWWAVIRCLVASAWRVLNSAYSVGTGPMRRRCAPWTVTATTTDAARVRSSYSAFNGCCEVIYVLKLMLAAQQLAMHSGAPDYDHAIEWWDKI